MRLTSGEVAAIKESAREAFGETAVVRLFGSRIDDSLRGGDIDLHVEVDTVSDEFQQKIVFEERFFRLTEPRRVDVVLSARDQPLSPFARICYRDGIVL